MAEINYYILDTETNGLSPKIHEVFEISIIRAKDRMQLSRDIRIKNPRASSFDALKITGKTIQDLLTQGIPAYQAINDVNEFINQDKSSPQNRCIIAHNSNFDRKFIWSMWEKENQTFPANLWLDSVQLFRNHLKSINITKVKAKLELACDFLKINKFANSHTAVDDSRNTYLLWKKLLELNTDYLDLIKILPHNVQEVSDEFPDENNENNE